MMPEENVLKKDLIVKVVRVNKLTQRLMYELQSHKGILTPAGMCRMLENLTSAEAIMEANCTLMVAEMSKEDKS